MPTRRRPCSPVPAALRGLGVLLVLLGVVAMHQLSGGTHTATMTITAQGPGTSPMHAAAPADVVHLAAVDVEGSEVAVPAVSSMPSPLAADAQATARPMAGHGAMPLCVAVLTGFALLALPTAGPAALASRPPATTRHDASPPGRGPPRALLAQLCVLRT